MGNFVLKYPDLEKFSQRIEQYFNECDERDKPYTVEGLAYSLDINRQTLLNYEAREDDPERQDIVKSAKLRIQCNAIERGLMGRNDKILTIFLMKNNFGYVDKVESETKVEISGITGMKIVPD